MFSKEQCDAMCNAFALWLIVIGIVSGVLITGVGYGVAWLWQHSPYRIEIKKTESEV